MNKIIYFLNNMYVCIIIGAYLIGGVWSGGYKYCMYLLSAIHRLYIFIKPLSCFILHITPSNLAFVIDSN